VHERVLLLDTGTPRCEYSEPLGIELLTSYVVNAFPHVSVDTFSLELGEYAEFEAVLKSSVYSVIGISAKIGSFKLFQSVMISIEKLTPKSLVVCGDILATYAFEQLLSMYKHLVCVIGEGEKAIVEIVSAVLTYKKKHEFRDVLSKINGIAYNDGSIKCTTRSAPFDVTQSLHPTRTLVGKIKEKRGIVHLEASRGCTYAQCSFCGIQQKYHIPAWRPFPVEYIESVNKL